MATPTVIMLFASGLILAVALVGYGTLVLIDYLSPVAPATIVGNSVVKGALSEIISMRGSSSASIERYLKVDAAPDGAITTPQK